MTGTILGLLIAIIAVLVALFKGKTPVKPPQPPTKGPNPLPDGVHLTLVVQTTNVSESEVVAYLAAQQAQINEDFSPLWGGSAIIDRTPGGWPVYLQDLSDVQNALGYHDVDMNNVPYGKVFILTSRNAGIKWESVASHEVLEILGDADANTTDLGPDGCKWVQETGDPVEDRFYVKNGVQVSDFVIPSWFTIGGKAPFDFLNVLTAPFTITPGGYAIKICNGQTVVVGGATSVSVDRVVAERK